MIAHMMFPRTRHRTRLLADQAHETLADVAVAADRLGLLAVNAPDMLQPLTLIGGDIAQAAQAHAYAAHRAAAAADDMALTVACVGLAIILATALIAWRVK